MARILVIRICNYFPIYGSCYAKREKMVTVIKPGRIYGGISRVLLGRVSDKAIYTSTGACRIIADRLQC